MGKRTLFLLLAIISINFLHAKEGPPPLLTAGGGYWEAGKKHSGSLIQFEYRFGSYCFYTVRPQLVFIFPECNAIFAGLGIGYEFYLTRHFLITPSFTPGAYFKGSRGRDMGFPLEFRSSIEAAFEWRNCRLGGQFYHISNASLGNRNPGGNAYVLFLAIPLQI
ncbi:MAG: acyloxyacyl hydrolase [Chlamydiales bacterium]|nr:acyloxyacyl hydrolase [Chlamydiales bacterium]